MVCDIIIALIVLTNFCIVTTGRINKVVQITVIQGILLSLLPIAMGLWHHAHILVMVCATTITKGFFIPSLFKRATSKLKIKKELFPYVSFTTSLVLCAFGTGLGLLLAKNLPIVQTKNISTLLIPASISTFFTGFILLITRKKALMQVVGYLILENSIYLFGLLLIENMPTLVETGILLDLFVGIFVMIIVINHITATFDSMDTRYLTELKD